MRRPASSGESALQMSKESGWRMSLQLMAILIAVSCLSPVMTHTWTDRCHIHEVVVPGIPHAVQHQQPMGKEPGSSHVDALQHMDTRW